MGLGKSVGSSIIILLSLVFTSTQALALEPTDCFSYYEFQNGIIFKNFQPENAVYSAGDTVHFNYEVISNMSYPIVEGRERVQILYLDESSEDLVDEFFVSEDVYLKKGDALRSHFAWKVPEGARTGKYVAKVYFVVKAFNLAGLSFIPYARPGVPGDQAFFEVSNANENYIMFERDKTFISGEKYEFGDIVPILANDTPITLKTSLKSYVESGTVDVVTRVYPWDDLEAEPIFTDEKQILLESGSSHPLEYEIGTLKPDAYEVVITANSEEYKDMLKLRFGVTGSKARFIYGGLSAFPLRNGEEYRVGICASNAADHTSFFEGGIFVEFRDANGNVVFEDSAENMVISPLPEGYSTEFTAGKDIYEGTLHLKMVDSESKIVDSVELRYDYSKFAGVEAELSLNVPSQVRRNEQFSYSIQLEDTEGVPLQGDLLLYIKDTEGNIKFTKKDLEIHGEKTGSIKAVYAPGTYYLTVRERNHNLYAEKPFEIAETAGRALPPKEGEKGISLFIWIGIIIAVFIGGVMYWWRK